MKQWKRKTCKCKGDFDSAETDDLVWRWPPCFPVALVITITDELKNVSIVQLRLSHANKCRKFVVGGMCVSYRVSCFLCPFSHFFMSVSLACCTRVRGHAHRSAPPRGWHSERIITINEKVNGAFSFISIYIWLFGCRNDFWVVVNNATVRRRKKRGLMCFCGHQMLWKMMHPLNANQMGLW